VPLNAVNESVPGYQYCYLTIPSTGTALMQDSPRIRDSRNPLRAGQGFPAVT
jgi:hypothetical protein